MHVIAHFFKKGGIGFEFGKTVVEPRFAAGKIYKARVGVQNFACIDLLEFYAVGAGFGCGVGQTFRLIQRAAVRSSYFRDDNRMSAGG